MSGRFKKGITCVLVAILVAIALVGLFSCKQKKATPRAATYKVEFSTSLLPYTAEPPVTQTVKTGDRAVEPTTQFAHTAGYVVIWSTSHSAKVAYDFSRPVTQNLYLYAMEVPRSYTITYLWAPERNLSNGNNPTSFTKETPTISLVAPTLDPDKDFGYSFSCWSYADDPTSVVAEIPKGTDGDVILRANLKAINYKIYYKEAENNPNPTNYLFGTELSLKAPTREGYEFLGFTIYLDSDETPVTALTPEFVKTHAKALFYGNGNQIGLEAHWRKK